jgi:hypothetical protein
VAVGTVPTAASPGALAELLGDPRACCRWSWARHAAWHCRTAPLRGRPAAAADGFDAEVSVALLADGDQECLGLTLRRVDQRLTALPPQVGELAAAIDRLAAQVGLVSLPELLQETTDLAERHLLAGRAGPHQGDRLQAAQLLGIGIDNLWLRLRHHGSTAPGMARIHRPAN